MIVKAPRVLKFYIKMYCQHRKEWSGICIARQSKFFWENYDDCTFKNFSKLLCRNRELE